MTIPFMLVVVNNCKPVKHWHGSYRNWAKSTFENQVCCFQAMHSLRALAPSVQVSTFQNTEVLHCCIQYSVRVL